MKKEFDEKGYVEMEMMGRKILHMLIIELKNVFSSSKIPGAVGCYIEESCCVL